MNGKSSHRAIPGEAAGPPTGFVYLPEFISEPEERALLAGIAGIPFAEVRMHGVAAKRTVAHFGWDYGYETWRIEPAPPIPAFLEDLRARCAEAAGLVPDALAETLVTRYPPGAGIGWHRDAPMFGPTVVGVSLLSSCVLRFRRSARAGAAASARASSGDSPARAKRNERAPRAVLLEPRSAYILSGEARSRWQHAIHRTEALRYSISFRTVRNPPGKETAR